MKLLCLCCALLGLTAHGAALPPLDLGGIREEHRMIPMRDGTRLSGYLSQIFNRGHRIRVTVSSSGAPFYEPNPQTGAALSVEPPQGVAAKNTLFHQRDHASRIIAPVVVAP